MTATVLAGVALAGVFAYTRLLRLTALRSAVVVVITALCLAPAMHSPELAAAYCVTALLLTAVTAALPLKWQPAATMLLLGALAFVLVQGNRQPLWASPASLPTVGVFGAIAFAASNGVARGRAHATIVFVVTLIAAMEDVRLAPFFAMVAAPFAVEAGLT